MSNTPNYWDNDMQLWPDKIKKYFCMKMKLKALGWDFRRIYLNKIPYTGNHSTSGSVLIVAPITPTPSNPFINRPGVAGAVL